MPKGPIMSGERVRLKSGGPIMKCQGPVEGDWKRLRCTWIESGTVTEATFARAELKRFKITHFIAINTGGPRQR